MRFLSADFIFTPSLKLEANKVLIVNDDNSIVEIKDKSSMNPDKIEEFEGILCPGFVNAHCHLELSHLKDKITQKTGLVGFIKQIPATRNIEQETILEQIKIADELMFKEGIVAVGDISNGTDSLNQKLESKLYYHTFVEVFGFHPDKANEVFEEGKSVYNQFKAQNLSASIVSHANYSVSKPLLDEIIGLDENFSCIHNQETESEDELFKTKKGDFITFYKSIYGDINHFSATEKSALQSVFCHFPKEQKMQFVHNSFSQEEDFRFAKNHSKNTFWCTCPNANLYIENTLPNYKLWIKNNLKITIGTDSLASNHSLSILEEMKTIQKHSSSISLEHLLSWATINGAEFLEIDHFLGDFTKGKKPSVNWIKNVQNKRLTQKSVVQKVL